MRTRRGSATHSHVAAPGAVSSDSSPGWHAAFVSDEPQRSARADSFATSSMQPCTI
jgi:hypothetical protein